MSSIMTISRGFFVTGYFFLGIAMLMSCNQKMQQEKISKPNIIIMYADDLGYGDVGAYGASGVETSHIDYLAANGVRFTDAHSAASTCTPSRYSLLTGNYAFRRSAQVLPGDAPLLIRPGTPTLPSLLKKVGYKTAVVGKWHLGLGDGDIDWNEEIKPGPLEIGFDYSFLLPSTGDRVPSVYMENHKVMNLELRDSLIISFTDDPTQPNPYERPTGITHPELLKQQADTQHSGSIINGLSRIGFMGGGKNAEIIDEEMADVLLEKSIDFMHRSKENPFFLYFSFHDIHVPRMPHPRFDGASNMGPRGDAIAQMDWVVGKVLEYTRHSGIEKNTLIIFTSDNGPVLNDGYEDGAVEKLGNHAPSGAFRGGKYSAYEAGTRVPTITYWPGRITPDINDALWSQVDLYASLASFLEIELDKIPKDSQNMIDVLLGRSNVGRKIMLEESYTFSVRDGSWKYIAPSTKDYTWVDEIKEIESGILSVPQLFNLQEDPAEANDLSESRPDKLAEMQSHLKAIIDEK